MAIRILLLIGLLAAPAFPLACTSAGAGVWSAAATWSACGGGVPGSGDTIAIAHQVTVGDNRTVGHSPGASDVTAAIQINAGGSVVISSGIELRVRGDIKFAAPGAVRDVIYLYPGAILTMDPTLSATRTTAAYIIGPSGTPIGGNSPQIRAACTPGSLCAIRTLRTNGDEARARFSRNGQTAGGSTGNPNYFIEYTDFTDLGTGGTAEATDYAISTYTPTTYRFENCTFTRTGIVGMPATELTATADYRMVNATFDQSLAVANLYVNVNANALTTGTRLVRGSYFDKTFMPASGPGNVRDFTIEYNAFAQRFVTGSTGRWAANRWNVFLTNVGGGPIGVVESVSDCYVLDDTGGNTRGLNISPATYGVTIQRCIFQTSGTGNGGDLITSVANAGNGITHTIRDNLGLPSTGDPAKSSGTLLSTGAATNPANHAFENNTMFGGTTASYDYGPFLSEGASARANTITSYRGNLYWGMGSQSPKGMHFLTQNGTLSDNLADPAVCDYNAAYLAGSSSWPGKSSDGSKYNIPMMGGVPGANDVNDVDPQFPDTSRNLERWALSKGGAATVASALLLLRQNPSTQIPDLINWVRRGFVPRNMTYGKTAAPSGRIGLQSPTLMFGGINE